LKYFIDNCLSYRFAPMLQSLDRGEVISLREHFPQDAADLIWIPELGRNGWTLLSVDHNQTRRPEERAALKKAGAIAFYLAKSFIALPFGEQAWRLVKFWPDIADAAEAAISGGCYHVKINGKIEPIKI
jgi:hypothetical protein